MAVFVVMPLMIFFIWLSLFAADVYSKNVLEPRRAEAKRLMLEAISAEALAIEMRHAQHAALTLEDKIWLFDMGRTEWSPEDELGFTPKFSGAKSCIYVHYGKYNNAAKKIYLWDLPDWYVDFLTTRPFHSDLAKKLYDWSCEGIEPKVRIAEWRQEHLDAIAEKDRLAAERERRQREHEEEMYRIEQERTARAKAERLERERREREDRKQRALELEEMRRKKLGLTGTYIDKVVDLYRSGDWDAVRDGRRIVRYAPGSNARLAIERLQHDLGLPVTGRVDEDTLREMQVQSEIASYVEKQQAPKAEITVFGEIKPLRVVS